MIKTYQSPKLTLAEDEVFQFGSNENGWHGAGSAGFASFGESGNVWRKHQYDLKPNGWKGKWNVKGASVGPQVGTEGKSYAIPTVTRAGAKRSIPLETIKGSIQAFYAFAKSRPHLKFFVAQEKSGGLNGYSGQEMAGIYAGDIPDNVYFSEGFAELIEEVINNSPSKTKFRREIAKVLFQFHEEIFNDPCKLEKQWNAVEGQRDFHIYSVSKQEYLRMADGVIKKFFADKFTKNEQLEEKEITPKQIIAPESRHGLKTIVAGSRSIADYNLICAAIKESEFIISEIVSGTAKGVDQMGERFAAENNLPIKKFPSDWNDLSHPDALIKTNSSGKKYDARAGFRRNQDMADYSDALIAITTGSSGTADMIERAKKKGLTIFVKEVK